MSRKSFIIWGLVIISLCPLAIATLQYLSLSRAIDAKTTGSGLVDWVIIISLLAFVTLLHLRFREVGRRKRILALSAAFYSLSLLGGAFLMLLYLEIVVSNSGADERFFNAIYKHVDSGEAGSAQWTAKEIIDYVLILMPITYLINWGLFALLWFGSLDPRTPSNNRVVQFLKTGFRRKSAAVKRTNFAEVAHG